MQELNLIKELQRAFSTKMPEGILDLDRFLGNRVPISILRMEDLHQGLKGKIPPYRQSQIFLLYVKKGSGKRSIGHYTFTIEDNSLAVVPKHVIHTAIYTRRPTGYFIAFNPDFLLQQAFPYKLLTSKQVLQPSLQPFMILDEGQAALITSIFETMISEANSQFEDKNQMLALKLLELLLLCDRYFTDKAYSKHNLEYGTTIQAFNNLIEQHFHTHRNVHFYANELHIHQNHLNHIVKKATGLTAKQTITNRLIIEAKYLLFSTELSIKEIAYKLGFEDPNYFHSFFKKEQTITPLQYRHQFL